MKYLRINLLAILVLLSFFVLSKGVLAEEDEIIVDSDCEQETIVYDDGIDNDELFEAYVNKMFYGDTEQPVVNQNPTAVEASYTKPLTGLNAKIYEILEDSISDIASGTENSTIISFDSTSLTDVKISYTAAELEIEGSLFNCDENNSCTITEEAKNKFYEVSGYDLVTIIRTLLFNKPYELYWYDKTRGVNQVIYFGGGVDGEQNEYICINEISYSFIVANEYKGTGDYTVNSTGVIISNAVARAEGVVETHKNENDLEKLISYKDFICGEVSYNSVAVQQNYSYGNPWQLIWVFDNNTNTNVVCEGYSKAFQYLCDKSTFKNNTVKSSIVTGTMSGGTGAGLHMWNVVKMNNGNNYIVDVTNCDEGTVGADDKLFLAGATRGADIYSYTVTIGTDNVGYVYDDVTIGLYDVSDLVLWNKDFEDNVWVSFTLNHGYLDENQSSFLQVARGTEITMPSFVPYEGITFLYWEATIGEETIHLDPNDTITVNEDVVFHDVCTFRITLDANGGAFADDSLQKYVDIESAGFDENSKFNLLIQGINAPERDGYTFKGWYYGPEAVYERPGNDGNYIYRNDKYEENTYVGSSITAYAQWIDNNNEVTITFDAGEGQLFDTTYAKVTGNVGEEIQILAFAYQSGKSFENWVYQRDGKYIFTKTLWNIELDRDTTVYAVYEDLDDDQVLLTFHSNGGHLGSPQGPETVTIKSPNGWNLDYITEYIYPIFGWFGGAYKDGYDTVQWFYDEELENNPVNIFDEDGYTTDTHFYAKWSNELNHYTVTFNPNNGSSTSSLTAFEGRTISKPVNPEKEGYSLAGWYKPDGSRFFFSMPVTSELNLTAKWIPSMTTSVDNYIPEYNDGDAKKDVAENGVNSTVGISVDVNDYFSERMSERAVSEETLTQLGTTIDNEKIVMETRLNMEVTSTTVDANDNVSDFVIDITPVYTIKAVNNDNTKTVTLQKEKELIVDDAVLMRVYLPSSFTTEDKAWVSHKGKVFGGETGLSVKSDSTGAYVEFYNSDGFSPFEISKAKIENSNNQANDKKVAPKFTVSTDAQNGKVIVSVDNPTAENLAWLKELTRLANQEHDHTYGLSHALVFVGNRGYKYNAEYGFSYNSTNNTVEYDIKNHMLTNDIYNLTVRVEGYYDVSTTFELDFPDAEPQFTIVKQGDIKYLSLSANSADFINKFEFVIGAEGWNNESVFHYTKNYRYHYYNGNEHFDYSSIVSEDGKTVLIPLSECELENGMNIVKIYAPGYCLKKMAITVPNDEFDLGYTYTVEETVNRNNHPAVKITLSGSKGLEIIEKIKSSLVFGDHNEYGGVIFEKTNGEHTRHYSSRQYPDHPEWDPNMVFTDGANSFLVNTNPEITNSEYTLVLRYPEEGMMKSVSIGTYTFKHQVYEAPKTSIKYNPETGKVEVRCIDNSELADTYLENIGLFIELDKTENNNNWSYVYCESVSNGVAYFSEYETNNNGRALIKNLTVGSYETQMSSEGFTWMDSIATEGRNLDRINITPKVVAPTELISSSSGISITTTNNGNDFMAVASKVVTDAFNGDTNGNSLSDEAVQFILNSTSSDKISASIIAEESDETEIATIASNIDDDKEILEAIDLSVVLTKKSIIGETTTITEGVKELASPLEYSIELPEIKEAIPEGNIVVYSVERYHDGKVETLESKVSNGNINFASDCYSTFAITYKLHDPSEHEWSFTSYKSDVNKVDKDHYWGTAIYTCDICGETKEVEELVPGRCQLS
ncbi:MAG: InlB B-repeat-containing protein, partial [Erysipelotrichaceae bacterium]|nr:InlB B-repeat-containing protein [Erysipelotrichaceae bacterium]